MYDIDSREFLKEAAIISNFLGKNISKATNDLNVAKGIAEGMENNLRGTTKSGLFRKNVPLSEKEIARGTKSSKQAVRDAQDTRNKEVMKTFKTRVGVGGAGIGAGAVAAKVNADRSLVAEPNYTDSYETDNYKYITAESMINNMMLKEAAVSAKSVRQIAKGVKDNFKSDAKAMKDRFHSGFDFSSGNSAKDILTFSRPRNAQKALSFAGGKGKVIPRNASPETMQKVTDMRKDLFELKHYDELSKKHKNMADAQKNSRFMGEQRAHESRMDSDELGKVYGNKWKGVAEDAKISKNYANAADDVASQVKPDLDNLIKYRDNEIVKSLVTYGGIGGVGFTAKKIYDGKKGEQ